MTNLDRGFSRMGGSYTTPSNDADEFEFTTEGATGRNPWLPVVAIGILIAFVGGVWVAYQQGMKQGMEGAPPLVTADRSPYKVEPEERGGLEPPADRRVYDVVEGTDAGSDDVEALMRREEAEDVIDASAPAAGAAAATEPAVEGGDVVVPKPSERLVAGTSAPAGAADPRSISAEIPRAKPESIRQAAAPAPAPASRVAAAAPAQSAPAPERSAPDRNTPLQAVNRIGAAPAATRSGPPAPAANNTANSGRAKVAAAPAAAAPKGGFVVQVGSYNSNALAQDAWSTFTGKHQSVLGGQPHTVTRADLGSKGIWYRLGVGPFATKAQASDICSQLKARKQDCLVRKL